MTLDPKVTFGPHANLVVDKVASRLSVLKAVSGTDWGSSCEDLQLTFKSILASIFDYTAPVFSPNLKPSNVKKL